MFHFRFWGKISRVFKGEIPDLWIKTKPTPLSPSALGENARFFPHTLHTHTRTSVRPRLAARRQQLDAMAPQSVFRSASERTVEYALRASRVNRPGLFSLRMESSVNEKRFINAITTPRSPVYIHILRPCARSQSRLSVFFVV